MGTAIKLLDKKYMTSSILQFYKYNGDWQNVTFGVSSSNHFLFSQCCNTKNMVIAVSILL